MKPETVTEGLKRLGHTVCDPVIPRAIEQIEKMERQLRAVKSSRAIVAGYGCLVCNWCKDSVPQAYWDKDCSHLYCLRCFVEQEIDG